MELRQLEYFQIVSHLNSITRASEQLYVTQPTITLAIQKLEKELGVPLFDRSQRNFNLTTEGRVFLQRVNSILLSLKDAVLEMQDYKHVRRGIIKLGIPPMIGSFFFLPIFTEFQKQHPQLELITIEAGSMAIRELLESGELDLGIVIISESSPLLETLTITKGQIHVCLPMDHSLSTLPSIPFELLRDQSFVLISEGTYIRHIITNEFERHQFNPHIILSSSQIETLRCLVKNGVGVSFLVDFIARQCADIVSKPLSDPLYLEIGLAWKKDKYLSSASQVFMQYISNLIKLTIEQ